jgi:SAM-dependent methyltransferase
VIVLERTHCAVCRARDFESFAELGHRRIVRCRSCRFVFAEQFDEEELGRAYVDDYYASKDDERIQQWIADNAGVWTGLCDTLARHVPAPSSLLDIGAGTGGFLQEYHRRNPDVPLFAVESSANARASLLERLPGVEFVAEDAGDLRGIDGRFGAVTLLQTLEHVYEPAALCTAIRGALEPGGALLVTVPNNRSWSVTLRGTRDEGCYGNPTHLQFFDRPSLEQMLRDAGFVRLQRIVGFGGSNASGLPKELVQYALRLLGRSNELRYVAWR